MKEETKIALFNSAKHISALTEMIGYNVTFFESQVKGSPLSRIYRNLQSHLDGFKKQNCHYLPKSNEIIQSSLDEDKLRALSSIFEVFFECSLAQLEAFEDELKSKITKI